MQQRLEDFGGTGAPVIFAHANGYPVGSYRLFLEELAAGYQVSGIHHRPMWSSEVAPYRLNWDCFTDDLLETVAALAQEPVWMMGHSMGGVVSLKAAARQPELFRGLILLDPVFILPDVAAARAQMPPEQVDEIPLVRKTLSRPNRFASRQQAFDFHREKRVFADFSDEVLWDYIRAGTRPTGAGDYELAYCREWEAAAYRSDPAIWDELPAVSLPVLGLRGETSNTLSPEAFDRWASCQPQADLRTLAGGHLFPLEQPAATAAVVMSFLAGQAVG